MIQYEDIDIIVMWHNEHVRMARVSWNINVMVFVMRWCLNAITLYVENKAVGVRGEICCALMNIYIYN